MSLPASFLKTGILSAASALWSFTANANPSFRNRCAENSTKMEEIPFMLQIENLEKEFIMHIRGDAEIEGFDCISFSAKAGTLIAVTGPSGSGKSSLLKCIYRTYTPTGGHTYYTCEDGNVVDLAVAEHWEIIRLRAQKSGMSPSFSALSHVFPPSTSSPIPRPPVESPPSPPGNGPQNTWRKWESLPNSGTCIPPPSAAVRNSG